MLFQEAFPATALQPYIRSYYFCDSDLNVEQSYIFPSDGGVEVIFILKNHLKMGFNASYLQYLTGVKLIGPYSRTLHITSDIENTILGIRFHPGRVRNFFPVFSDEIIENIVNLSDLWGEKGRNLEEKVHSARSFNEITGILDEFFLKHLLHEKNNHISESAVQIIKNSKGQLFVKDIADNLNISKRQLERIFIPSIGISPKRLCRIERFMSLLQYISIYPEFAWAEIAAEWGFSDQAHLIKEFNFFTGMSPERSVKIFSEITA